MQRAVVARDERLLGLGIFVCQLCALSGVSFVAQLVSRTVKFCQELVLTFADLQFNFEGLKRNSRVRREQGIGSYSRHGDIKCVRPTDADRGFVFEPPEGKAVMCKSGSDVFDST